MQKVKLVVDNLHDSEARSLLFQILLKIESCKQDGIEKEAFTQELEGLYDHLLYYKAKETSSYAKK